MSYTIDANLLLYASNRDCDEHEPARQFKLLEVINPLSIV